MRRGGKFREKYRNSSCPDFLFLSDSVVCDVPKNICEITNGKTTGHSGWLVSPANRKYVSAEKPPTFPRLFVATLTPENDILRVDNAKELNAVGNMHLTDVILLQEENHAKVDRNKLTDCYQTKFTYFISRRQYVLYSLYVLRVVRLFDGKEKDFQNNPECLNVMGCQVQSSLQRMRHNAKLALCGRSDKPSPSSPPSASRSVTLCHPLPILQVLASAQY
uniref:Uncharacterized protein n=1 Tax=Vespula pensylvanica TaxID=30213 RepID=A0A834KCY8_VESPE|nr:hypothetical protein H0235_015086 [Vespula pensylvanica]